MGEAQTAEVCSREFSSWWREAGSSELKQLLYWVWDPIALNEQFPDAADEYDRYAIEIATALASGMSTSVLAALIATIERDRMGLAPRSLDAFAERLDAWYTRSRERFSVRQLAT